MNKMGEIHDRLNDVGHLIATSRIELWIAEFVLIASRTPTPQLPALIKKWFGDES